MTEQQISRLSKLGSLNQVKNLGFNPKVVIDVGAAVGTFELYNTFPNAKHILIEPIEENGPHLAKICQNLTDAEYIIGAATKQPGSVGLAYSSDLVFSTTRDISETTNNSGLRIVQGVTLDQVCAERGLQGPYLIKIDVDGNEVDVLTGAMQVLKQAEYVVIEVTFFIQVHDVIDFMRSQGFVIYDIIDFLWRPSDGALWQVDMAFVKESSPFRLMKSYLAPHEETMSSQINSWRESYINYINATYPGEGDQVNS
ncbi:MAG: FkbM family methyltransferase [Microcoleaceae cyanobacterium]